MSQEKSGAWEGALKRGPLPRRRMAEGEGFEPPVALRLRLISSQVPSTTQPPFRSLLARNLEQNIAGTSRALRAVRCLIRPNRDWRQAHSTFAGDHGPVRREAETDGSRKRRTRKTGKTPKVGHRKLRFRGSDGRIPQATGDQSNHQGKDPDLLLRADRRHSHELAGDCRNSTFVELNPMTAKSGLADVSGR